MKSVFNKTEWIFIGLIIMLTTALFLTTFLYQKALEKNDLPSTMNYYDVNNCEMTQECENRCNDIEHNRSMFCDYVCMEKKYCDPSNNKE